MNTPGDSHTTLIKLYGGPRTRASIVKWYLEEISLPYESIDLDLQGGENQKPEYLAINPVGKVPAIVDGEVKIWESGAILLYLAEKYGPGADSSERRAALSQWVMFANATLALGLFLEDRRDSETPKLLNPLNGLLEQQSFLVGNELSVADIAVGAYLHYSVFMASLDLIPYPAVQAYLTRLSERPAFQKALGQR